MASPLLLVPTSFERDCFSKPFFERVKQANIPIELCGFGLVVSAIRTTKLIELYSPSQVLLVGIAGSLDPMQHVGTAVEFGEAVCYGIGAGTGDGFLPASEMGWKQWGDSPEISDAILLNSGLNQATKRSVLLSCCAASATARDVQMRVSKHANAVAEDMEGFAVAAACRFAGVPIRIVRGISNLAGDRNKSNWRVYEAMATVEKWIEKWICEECS